MRAKGNRFSATRVLAGLAALSVCGMAGLAALGLLGFEEPDTTLLLISSALVFAAPIAVLVHLGFTRELTREEKRIWIHELTGRRAPWAFSDYVTTEDRRATTRKLSEEAPARRDAH
jgi:hypothetical protein